MPYPTSILMYAAVSATIACSAAESPVRASSPPPPPGLVICVGSLPRDPCVAATLSEATRRGSADAIRTVWETAADRLRGDDPERSSIVIGELVRTHGVSGIKPIDRRGAPTGCMGHSTFLTEGEARGVDIGPLVGEGGLGVVHEVRDHFSCNAPGASLITPAEVPTWSHVRSVARFRREGMCAVDRPARRVRGGGDEPPRGSCTCRDRVAPMAGVPDLPAMATMRIKRALRALKAQFDVGVPPDERTALEVHAALLESLVADECKCSDEELMAIVHGRWTSRLAGPLPMERCELAVAHLHCRYKTLIYARIRRIDEEHAKELTSDVFGKVFATSASKYTPPTPFRPWIYRVATNEALSCLRKHRTEPLPDHIPDAVTIDPDAPRTRDAIADCVGQLSEALREVYELWEAGVDDKEIASKLGIKYGAAKTRLSRARAQLQLCLLAKGISPGEAR